MKNKKIIILIILILISILTLIGSSYALLTKTFTSKKLSVEVGTLKVDFTEGNAINLDNTKPMSDSDGLNTTPYTFTITNSGTIDSYYTISNEEDTNNTLDTTYLKYKLVSNDGYDSGIKRLKDIGTGTYRIVDERTLLKSKSVTYKLYLWIASDASNNIQDKLYKSKIVVNSISNKGTLDMKCRSVGGKYIDGECRKYYVMKNQLVANPDFSQIISGWNTYNLVVEKNNLHYNPNNKYEHSNANVYNINIDNSTHFFYEFATSSIDYVQFHFQTLDWTNSNNILAAGSNFSFDPKSYTNNYSIYFVPNKLAEYFEEAKGCNPYFSENSVLSIGVSFYIDTDDYLKLSYKNINLIDLTLMFGAGNEPSKEWCDKNLNTYVDYNETGIKTPITDINYTGITSYYDVIDISK